MFRISLLLCFFSLSVEGTPRYVGRPVVGKIASIGLERLGALSSIRDTRVKGSTTFVLKKRDQSKG